MRKVDTDLTLIYQGLRTEEGRSMESLTIVV